MPPRAALVTGATGFVGSHLVDALLARGHSVRALVRPTSDTRRLREQGADVVVADLTDASEVGRALAGRDVVYHLAAATRARDETEYRRSNVDATAAIVRAAAAQPAPPRVVVLGSLAAVGPSLDGEAVAEDAESRPLTAYGRTKLEGERVALATPNVPVVVLRAPAVYGPRDRDLFTFFRLASLGVMPVPAGPDRPVQLIHVRDLVDALLAAAESNASGRVYHVAEPCVRPWSEVAAMIARAVGKRPLHVPIPRTALRLAAWLSETGARATGRATIFNRDKVRELLAPGWICTTDRAERELGFRATIPLERGIAETAAWYRSEGWLSAAS